MSTVSHKLPRLTLYTNHGCGWCHRVHITLRELKLDYDEVLIDLNGPRPDWYLKLNPRGLVPTLHVKTEDVDEFLVESGPIVDFLTELYPSHLTPNGGTPTANAVLRWRQRFFVDNFFNKVVPLFFKLSGIADRDAQMAVVNDTVTQVEKEIEPLLIDAAPHFGGSSTITVVEALSMPFVMLVEDLSDDVVWPLALSQRLHALPNYNKWAKAGLEHESVLAKVAREPRKKAILERLSEVRMKYANHNGN